jgi:hypothetical protein
MFTATEPDGATYDASAIATAAAAVRAKAR